MYHYMNKTVLKKKVKNREPYRFIFSIAFRFKNIGWKSENRFFIRYSLMCGAIRGQFYRLTLKTIIFRDFVKNRKKRYGWTFFLNQKFSPIFWCRVPELFFWVITLSFLDKKVSAKFVLPNFKIAGTKGYLNCFFPLSCK